MKTIPQKYILPALALAFACVSSLFAETILFNDTVQNGGSFANGTITIDSSITFPDTGNTDTLKWTPDGSYKSGGLQFWGGKSMVVPTGTTNLEFSFYADVVGSWYLNDTTVNFDTGSFNIATDSWTLDGAAGATGNVSGQTWHTINLDLTSIANFEAGTSVLNGLVTIKNNTALNPVYIGDIRLTSIPEPSSVVLLLVAGGLLLYLRRKK
ncbi:PEP-CTERM sorting domain-containing protein [Kiritimatiellota bacterium B12222]|nr:PEP-CTERM sorting domain-containing protein [Kiritimatiellota bacterium B12222]